MTLAYYILKLLMIMKELYLYICKADIYMTLAVFIMFSTH
jgi:hypothetical protein